MATNEQLFYRHLRQRLRRRKHRAAMVCRSLAVLGLAALAGLAVRALASVPVAAPETFTSALPVAPAPRATTTPTPRAWDRSVNAHPARGTYQRFFRMTVTAYTPINTRMEGGRYTATSRDGRRVHGVAVDPDLIPLGSRLWIPGYGHALADDTGGRIQGHHVDLRYQNGNGMNRWGVRHAVRVYVLADAPGNSY